MRAIAWRTGVRSGAVLSCTTISRLGLARPDSRKLTWRCDTPDCRASASWLAPRRRRQARSIGPNISGWEATAGEVGEGEDVRIMTGTVAPGRGPADYLARNCCGGAAVRPLARPYTPRRTS